MIQGFKIAVLLFLSMHLHPNHWLHLSQNVRFNLEFLKATLNICYTQHIKLIILTHITYRLKESTFFVLHYLNHFYQKIKLDF